jgi:hypothetical protein
MVLQTKNARKKKSHFIPSVFPSGNCHITKKNTICNFVGNYLKLFFKKIYLTKLENN